MRPADTKGFTIGVRRILDNACGVEVLTGGVEVLTGGVEVLTCGVEVLTGGDEQEIEILGELSNNARAFMEMQIELRTDLKELIQESVSLKE